MPRKTVTSRFRGTDMFSRRIVITVSRSGLLAIVVAIAVAGTRFPYSIITIISVICAVVSLITTIEARHQVRNLRYETQEREIAILEHWTVPDDLPDLRESIESAFEDFDEFDAASTELRIPKRPNSS